MEKKEAGKWNRRDVLRVAVRGALVVLAGGVGSSAVADPLILGFDPRGVPGNQGRYWLVVRPERCTGCGACVTACRHANHLPSDTSRITIHLRQDGGRPARLPVMCQQCREAPCITVCPSRASHRDAVSGLVMVDRRLCVGCHACIMACPYGARRYVAEKQAVDGCDFCMTARLLRGKKTPVCVEACPEGVFSFGTTEGRPLTELFPESSLMVLRPERGTRPAVYYRLRQRNV